MSPKPGETPWMNALDAHSADEVARLLGLAPHPERGLHRETFRDPRLCAFRNRAAGALAR
jgi:predicted cupin superfamily sugar epimerase